MARTAVAVALALGLLLADASRARGEEPPDVRLGPPFPRDTERFDEPPWYRPVRGLNEGALRAWCSQMAELGRRRIGTRLGGDVLGAAAHVLYHGLTDKEFAHAVYAQASEAYPSGDPSSALALYEMAQREVWRGNVPVAGKALATLETWARAPWPRSVPAADRRRWSLLAILIDERLPRLRADVLEGNGKYGESAAELEKLAGTTTGGASERIGLWERAARLYARAPDRDNAVRAATQLVALRAGDPRERSYWKVWRAYARHGMVAESGAIGPTRSQAPDAFYEELLDVAREESGEGGMDTNYLSMGSSAFVAGKKRIALEIYLLALRDPSFVEKAYDDVPLRDGLLIAVDIAADLERFEDAEWILASLERMTATPIDNIEDFRVGVEKARRHLDDRLRSKGRTPPEREPLPEPEPERKPLRRIESGEEPPDGIPGPGRAEEPDGLPWWIWLAGGVVALFALATVLRRRR